MVTWKYYIVISSVSQQKSAFSPYMTPNAHIIDI